MKEKSSYNKYRLNNLSGLESWSSTDGALEGNRRRCCDLTFVTFEGTVWEYFSHVLLYYLSIIFNAYVYHTLSFRTLLLLVVVLIIIIVIIINFKPTS